MKLSHTLLSFSIVAVLLPVSAAAEGPRPSRYNATNAAHDILSAYWVTGVSIEKKVDSQSLVMKNDSYYSFRNWWDQSLSDVTRVRASWLLGGGNAGISPRFNIELDVNGNGVFAEPTGSPADEDAILYLSASLCNDKTSNSWITANFTGDRTNCVLTDSKGNVFTSGKDGTAWSKVVAHYPTAKVWFAYLIQDERTVTNVVNLVDRISLDSTVFTNQP